MALNEHGRLIVSVIGGFSDLKQRRLLSMENNQPLHILVATPGRLLELMEDITITRLQDMSQVRYLVVDEADRIMEEGHFAEVRARNTGGMCTV